MAEPFSLSFGLAQRIMNCLAEQVDRLDFIGQCRVIHFEWGKEIGKSVRFSFPVVERGACERWNEVEVLGIAPQQSEISTAQPAPRERAGAATAAWRSRRFASACEANLLRGRPASPPCAERASTCYPQKAASNQLNWLISSIARVGFSRICDPPMQPSAQYAEGQPRQNFYAAPSQFCHRTDCNACKNLENKEIVERR